MTKGLHTFLATSTRLTAVGAQLLGNLVQLKVLSLSFNPRIQSWAFLRELANLEDLDLSLNCTVDDAVVAVITTHLPLLTYLNLERTEISSDSATSLRALTNLRVLDLR